MWKKNRTASWLSQKSDKTAHQIIEKGVKFGPQFKSQNIDELKAIKKQILANMLENKRKKEEKEVKDKQKTLDILDSLLGSGHVLATSKEALDAIFNGPNALDNLKVQIRYRKEFLKEKLTLKGRKEDLYNRLLSQISSSSSSSN